ncbi:MAG TPA: FAD-dependent oxidoreductase [Syntrophales bacterium]|nr:FAD-dependent oxidoreductase [Syntrophales bacterium]HOX93733.1 FAD-dependent oxidoreductase [Syntrophales bacterium]HPI57079.1 FAD-dependent oxidoreductase [Syntrophales bacterium]HPN23791.1 FAD-dependent oxidoreductase [Syntrophales bacterium]HQM30138.1 FAD-dependent oxidoreductase [Syntrophales bacterium]
MPRKKAVTAESLRFFPRSYLSTEANKTGSWRFLKPRYEEKTAPCSAACPAGEDIARVEILTTQGMFKEAWETILRENPFPAVCGRVCYHPCESRCNRGEFDEAIAIHSIERFLADTAGRNEMKPSLERLTSKKQKIAVVGAGPSGLSAAYFLALLGYGCDVFEASEEPGGILRWGIPLYRLPLAALRKEVAQIQDAGVRIFTEKTLSKGFIDEAKGRYDAVFMGSGHYRSGDMGVPGEDLEGVEDGLKFLQKMRRGDGLKLESPVAVIGGGNSAVDVARSALRLGSRAIIVYRRRRQDMPAFPGEVASALEEGVELMELLAPAKVEQDGKDLVLHVRRLKVTGEDGKGRGIVAPDGKKTDKIRVRRIFSAIGEGPEDPWLEPPQGDKTAIALENCLLLPRGKNPVVIYGGDLTASIKSVVNAVASGKEAAMALDILLREGPKAVESALRKFRVGGGPSLSMEAYLKGPRAERSPHVVAYPEINKDYFELARRLSQPRLLIEERRRTFEEVELRVSANIAIREAERCFHCGLCDQCDNCYLFCPDLAVLRDDGIHKRRINYDYCKGCGVCVVECPRNAMALEEEKV